jgi:hypothetical protein
MRDLPEKDKHAILTYFSLCQALINHIDEGWQGNPVNRQTVKNRTEALLKALEGSINILFPKNPQLNGGAEVVGQFDDASRAMMTFYNLGVKIAGLDETKREALNNQLSILLKSYGLDLE